MKIFWQLTLGMLTLVGGGLGCMDHDAHATRPAKIQTPKKDIKSKKPVKTPAEWRAILTDLQYRILREKGTERPFTGQYWNEKRPGMYHCAGCGAPLFSSETKFKSGTGWPSFYAPHEAHAVEVEEDRSLGVVREEILCRRCGGHLGHVFDDGPKPTGLRYCVNSAALKFEPEQLKKKSP